MSGLLLLLLLAWTAPAAAAIASLNAANAAPSFAATGASISLNITAAPQNGHTVVVVVAFKNPAMNVSSVTDTGGSLYMFRGATTCCTTQDRVELWSTEAGGGKTSTTVTVNLTGGSGDTIAIVNWYSGVVALGPATSTTGNTTIQSISPFTQDSNNYIVAGFAASGATIPSANTGTLRKGLRTSGNTLGAALTDNTAASPGPVNNAVSIAGPEWTAMVALELRTVAPPVNFVNSASTIKSTNSTTCAMTLASVTPGNTNVVIVANSLNTSVVTGISDGASTYSRKTFNDGGTTTRIEIWSATIASGAGTTVTVTVAPTSKWVCAVAQYSGVTTLGSATNALQNTTADPTISLITKDNNNWVVAGFATAGSTAATGFTGFLRQSKVETGSPAVGAALTNQFSSTPASVTNAVEHAAGQWAAAALELRSKVCGAVTDEPAYVAANAQIAGGQVTVYWSSTNPVIVVRKSGKFTGQVPTNLTTYTAPSTPGGTLGTAQVVYVGPGSAKRFTETPPAGDNYYKVFAYDPSGPCYSASTNNTTDGVSANTTSPSPHAWSYTMAGGAALAAPIAGTGTLYTSSNAGRIISLDTADGTQSWLTPTTAAVQSWLSWIPLNLKYRKPITIDPTATKVIQGPHTDFPVLISILNDPDLQSQAQPLGGDIAFTASDGRTKLSHEIDTYDSTTGTLVAWVRMPSLSSNTTIYMYYGNASAPNQQDKTKVWDANYKGVWHFSEVPGPGATKDSTSNANDGNASATAPTLVTGASAKIGKALSFASNAYIDLTDKATFQLGVYSWSMWLYANAPAACLTSGDNNEVLYNADAQFNFSWSHWPDTSCPTASLRQSAIHQDAVGWKGAQIPGAALSAFTWYHFAATYDGTNLTVYKDGGTLAGGLQAQTPAGPPGAQSGAFTIGNFPGASTGFAGKVDEVRISSVARSAGWIATEYNTQSSPSTFHGVPGPEELTTSGSVIAGDLGTGPANSAKLYFDDSTSGVETWTKASLPGNGADAIVAAVSAQLWAYSNAAFRTALQANYSYSGDVVYAATRNTSRTGNTVYALKATDATPLWNFNASTTYSVDAIFGQPYVDYWRNLLYVASKAGLSNTQKNLWILDSTTGAVVQQLALGTNHMQTSPTLSYDGNTLYIADVTGNLYAVNLTACTSGASCTATLKWTGPAALASAIKDTAFVWEDWTTAGRLYFSTADGNVWCWQSPGVGGTPNVATACSGWAAVKTAVAGASTPLLLSKLFVSSWNGTTGQIKQICLYTPCLSGFNPGQVEKSVTVGDGTKQPGDVSTETGNELFVGTSDGKIFKYILTGGSL